jgi:hypothetical protein
MKAAHFMFCAVTFALAGCTQPAGWADKFESGLRCGTTIQEAEEIAGRTIEPLEVPNGWISHHIRDGSTDVLIGFSAGRARFVQVTWDVVGKERNARFQRVDLCGDAPDSPDTTHRVAPAGKSQ